MAHSYRWATLGLKFTRSTYTKEACCGEGTRAVRMWAIDRCTSTQECRGYFPARLHTNQYVYSCWFHDSHQPRHHQDYTEQTQYKLAKNCEDLD